MFWGKWQNGCDENSSLDAELWSNKFRLKMNHLNACLEYMIEQWKMLQQCCRVICEWENNQKSVFCHHQHNHSYRYPVGLVLFPVCMRHAFSLSPSAVEHSEVEGENWQKPYCSSSYRKCVKCGSDISEKLWSLQVQTNKKHTPRNGNRAAVL